MTTSMATLGGGESCPDCGARMATDQRYCLNCGRRRGEPRLPFMDAVTLMESMGAPGGSAGAMPPPPPAEQPNPNRWNANAALIAGVATLVLAIGVGFLIGRSGHEGSSGVQAEAPIKVIEVGGGGGETAEAATSGETTAADREAKGKSGDKPAIKAEDTGKATKKAEKNVQEGAHGQSESVEKVLHTEVPLAEPEVEVGGKCKEGAAGCEGGEFTGNFFGE